MERQAGEGRSRRPAVALLGERPRGFGQVGCIYTAQGFEYDWSGVIFGDRLRPADGAWVSRRECSFDRPVKRAEDGVPRSDPQHLQGAADARDEGDRHVLDRPGDAGVPRTDVPVSLPRSSESADLLEAAAPREPTRSFPDVTEIDEPTTKPVMTACREPTYPASTCWTWGTHERSVAVARPSDRCGRGGDPGTARRTPTGDVRPRARHAAPSTAGGRLGRRGRDGCGSSGDADRGRHRDRPGGASPYGTRATAGP